MPFTKGQPGGPGRTPAAPAAPTEPPTDPNADFIPLEDLTRTTASGTVLLVAAKGMPISAARARVLGLVAPNAEPLGAWEQIQRAKLGALGARTPRSSAEVLELARADGHVRAVD